MRLQKKIFVFFCLLIINLPELFYQISFKLNIDAGSVYVIFFGAALLFLAVNVSRIREKNIQVLLVLTFYCLLQLFNGFLSGSEIQYGLVVFISMLNIYFVSVFAASLEADQLKNFLVWLCKNTMIFLIIVDLLSIFYLGKSQHVILSNVLPLILISSIALFHDHGKSLVLYLIAYMAWILASVYFFTLDHRLQLKALFLSMLVCFSYVTFYVIKSTIRLPFFRKGGANVYFSLLVIVFFGAYTVYGYLSNNLLPGRETSLTLRYLVTQAQVNDYFSGGWVNLIFGYGLGSSMQSYHVQVIEYVAELRSHSGLVSLLYEHGIFFVLFFVTFVFFVFRDYQPAYRGVYIHKGFYQFSIFLLISTLIALNFFYLISVPVPNFAHQSQIVLVTATFVYFRKKAREVYG